MAVWELLAIVVALRGWYDITTTCRFIVRSGSLSAIYALRRGATTAPGLTVLLRELALLQVLHPFAPMGRWIKRM